MSATQTLELQSRLAEMERMGKAYEQPGFGTPLLGAGEQANLEFIGRRFSHRIKLSSDLPN